MKNIYSIILLALITSCNMPVENQTNNNGEPEGSHTSAEWQIWAYSTAAPDYIAADASVLGPDMSVLREGNNGWTCLPVNPRGQSDPENGWVDAHEAMPLCGDTEVFKWISAYLADETPVMDKDGYAWMLHGDMGEDNTTPKTLTEEESAEGQWIESGPHLMRMPADPASLDGMTTDFASGAPYVMFAGTVYAHVMYPMAGYYDYQPESAPE